MCSLNSSSRVKLISDDSSPLLKLEKTNMEQISNVLTKCSVTKPPQKINGPYDGYNKYPDLRADSYGNITSIGKSLITPYTSYPVPS